MAHADCAKSDLRCLCLVEGSFGFDFLRFRFGFAVRKLVQVLRINFDVALAKTCRHIIQSSGRMNWSSKADSSLLYICSFPNNLGTK